MIDERNERILHIQNRYDDYIRKISGEGISYGEIIHIEGLSDADLDAFEAELDELDD